MAIRLGKVSFINSLPLFCARAPDDFEIVPNIPSRLNSMVERGELDASLISRWVYPCVSKDYAVVGNYCIGGDGEIMSIKLFSHFPLESLGDKKIYITPQTGSSCRAFDFICRRKYGFGFIERSYPDAATADAALFIGNQALARDGAGYEFVYDLGKIWKLETGLPMLYAVYVVRREIFAEASVKIRDYAQKSLDLFESRSADFIGEARDAFKLDTGADISPETLARYYKCLKFKFNDADFEKSFNFVRDNGYI